MRKYFGWILALALVSPVTFASTSDAASDAEAAEMSVDSNVDSTESWGLDRHHDDYYFYKCVAFPKPYYGHGGGFWGDGYNMFEAKMEALRLCRYRTHKYCYIRFCKKVKKY